MDLPLADFGNTNENKLSKTCYVIVNYTRYKQSD